MRTALQVRWTEPGDERHEAAQSGVLAVLRALATPSNLLLGLMIFAGWLALVALTGVGPDGWQARSCASLDFGRSACSAVRPHQDQNRLALHASTLGFAQ